MRKPLPFEVELFAVIFEPFVAFFAARDFTTDTLEEATLVDADLLTPPFTDEALMDAEGIFGEDFAAAFPFVDRLTGDLRTTAFDATDFVAMKVDPTKLGSYVLLPNNAAQTTTRDLEHAQRETETILREEGRRSPKGTWFFIEQLRSIYSG